MLYCDTKTRGGLCHCLRHSPWLGLLIGVTTIGNNEKTEEQEANQFTPALAGPGLSLVYACESHSSISDAITSSASTLYQTVSFLFFSLSSKFQLSCLHPHSHLGPCSTLPSVRNLQQWDRIWRLPEHGSSILPFALCETGKLGGIRFLRTLPQWCPSLSCIISF